MSAWIDQIFNSAIAQRGGVVRRKISSVNWYSSPAELEAEVRNRGYHMIIHGDQYIIFCDPAQIQVIC